MLLLSFWCVFGALGFNLNGVHLQKRYNKEITLVWYMGGAQSS